MAEPAGQFSAWIRRFHPAPRPDAPLLALLPHAGGSASHYLALSAQLARHAEVVAVQYPGRQERYREPPVLDLAVLASQVAGALEPWADRPVSLFGHSMGALVAFEAARLLEGADRPAAALIVSARRAPGRPSAERVHLLDDTGLLNEIRALGGIDQRLLHEEELLRHALPTVRADYQALETHVCPPGAAVGCPVTALIGNADPRVSVPDADAWRRHTTGRFDLRVFPGGHFYLDSQVGAVADAVADAVANSAVGASADVPG